MNNRRPAVYKKRANRQLRLSRYATAKEAIGTIAKQSDTYILTLGQFSLIDAMMAILDQIGPAKVDLSTWTAADADLFRTMELMKAAKITRLRLVVDRSFEGRQPEYCAYMRRLFGNACIRAIRTHAKFLVMRSATMDIVVRTSMNLNENPRLENIEISEDEGLADFLEKVVDDIFSEVAEKENKSSLVALRDIPESFPFIEVKAHQVNRSDLHEPSYTHTLKKL